MADECALIDGDAALILHHVNIGAPNDGLA